MREEKDNRRNPRFDVEDVPGIMSFSVDAKVLNISRSGVAVETNVQLVIGRRYEAKIGYRGGFVSAAGTVRRCVLRRTRATEKGEVAPVYEAGIEFDEVLDEAQPELMPIVARSASLQLMPRLHGRFKPDQDETVTLESNVDFEVKRLSLSGLLVESDATPEPDSIIRLELDVSGQKLATAGRVADVSRVRGEGGVWRSQLGIEFLDLTDDDRKMLEAFLLDQVEKEF